jgi:hypothetical protein
MKTELMKKIENSRTIEKEKYIKNISSFNDFNDLEVEDLRTINRLIEAYKDNKNALEKAEKIKDKLMKYCLIYFNDSDDEAKDFINSIDLDDVDTIIDTLKYDFDLILKNKTKKERIKVVNEIKDFFKDVFVLTDKDFETALNRLEISDNWEKSLRTYSTSDLSHKLKYGFTKEEIKELATLHKETTKKIVKKRIEDLLTNCNFHSESGILADKDYNKILES